jgi:phosphate transport system substrate-binding protein
MYFYIKNSHIDQVPAIKEYVNLFMSEKMIGKDGILADIGLIPLDAKVREEARKKAVNFETIPKF